MGLDLGSLFPSITCSSQEYRSSCFGFLTDEDGESTIALLAGVIKPAVDGVAQLDDLAGVSKNLPVDEGSCVDFTDFFKGVSVALKRSRFGISMLTEGLSSSSDSITTDLLSLEPLFVKDWGEFTSSEFSGTTFSLQITASWSELPEENEIVWSLTTSSFLSFLLIGLKKLKSVGCLVTLGI